MGADPCRRVAEHLIVDHGELCVLEAGRACARGLPPLCVLGAGKAAVGMAAACEALGVEVGGLVITTDGGGAELRKIAVRRAGHPLPDGRGQLATAGLRTLAKRGDANTVVVLISGGASSLLVAPSPPLTLEDKVATTRLLLECGADIDEVNTVRKHLSAIKGGGLLRDCPIRPLIGLILSDVLSDDPSVIGSGPTAADPTTFADARAVLDRHGLQDRIPAAARGRLEAGSKGAIEDTVKPGDPLLAGVRNVVIGSYRTALSAAGEEARRLGYRAVVRAQPLRGDTTEAARRWSNELTAEISGEEPTCVIAGGETTVVVRGGGRGGRNQEFALVLAERLPGTTITVLSAGSDGRDGPTDAAGAFVDPTTAARAAAAGLDPQQMLARNDSYTFFSTLGDLFRCGPTGTNVMDLKIAVG